MNFPVQFPDEGVNNCGEVSVAWGGVSVSHGITHCITPANLWTHEAGLTPGHRGVGVQILLEIQTKLLNYKSIMSICID